MYLLDTNVVSELRRVRSGRADPGVAAWADRVDAASLFLSVITIHELDLGVRLMERRDATQGTLLRQWLEERVLPAFDARILPVDTQVAQCSAGLHVPDPRPLRDGFIAATALTHSLVVVTRNVSDFENCGLELLNPWARAA